MKNKTGLLLTVFLFLFGSCSNENFVDSEYIEVSYSEEEMRVIEEYAKKTPKITEKEAMQRALEAANSISFSPILTKTGKTIKNSKALTISKNIGVRYSNSTLPDTVAYIFNFDNNEGYTIVAADIRVPEKILSYVETGSLGLETDNPGFALFLEYAEEYILRSIEQAELKKDSIYQVILDKFIAKNPELAKVKTKNQDPNVGPTGPDGQPTELPYYCEVIETSVDWHNIDIIGPLTPVEWGQGEPYNALTLAKGCGGNAPMLLRLKGIKNRLIMSGYKTQLSLLRVMAEPISTSS